MTTAGGSLASSPHSPTETSDSQAHPHSFSSSFASDRTSQLPRSQTLLPTIPVAAETATMTTSPRTILFVTGNANKLKEVRAILLSSTQHTENANPAATPSFSVESQDLDVPEVQGTTEEVAKAKCKAAAEIVGGPCITEDTALAFEALGGLPGPYIKYFLKAVGLEGLNNMLAGFPSKRATAICTFAYSAGPGTEPLIFEGRTEGKIVQARGPTHFGWDPVFEPDEGEGKTYAEMDGVAKNKISHRYRALDKLRKYLLE
ncbi:putative DNA repair-related protein [Rhodotorula toruloides ATCC 204091]|uniref:Inosine triphosphate pyrophosphatase n=1 Tax=Rhodotorula toruloides TaxID=5286 RepID=A0A0K3CDU4_RHOTO|nr:putative DNA repair-related protein [Rhodotorula toruloides ATCC 204091]PRQ74878.1 putative DNA repair-related protein [Rhodotorula toruloides]